MTLSKADPVTYTHASHPDLTVAQALEAVETILAIMKFALDWEGYSTLRFR